MNAKSLEENIKAKSYDSRESKDYLDRKQKALTQKIKMLMVN